MSDIEFDDSDFTAAVSHLRQAGDAAVESFCPAFGVLGASVVESALNRVDGVVRSAMTALAGVGDELATDTATVHDELRRTDAQLAGGPR
jgi:hypothetical protein